MAKVEPQLPPLIAIIGCDGSGKSTVSDELVTWVSRYAPARSAHLGKQQGNTGRSLGRLPVVGGVFGRYIESKAARVRKGRTVKRAPDTFPALVMYAFTLRRVRRFQRMMKLRRRGVIVVADRYPQLDIPSAFDGPDMDIEAAGNDFVRWLARREYRAFKWMTSYVPDLVFRLSVDLDVACARKPDHKREALARKMDFVPRFTLGGARIVDIDANQPLEQVVQAVRAAASEFLSERGYSPQ